MRELNLDGGPHATPSAQTPPFRTPANRLPWTAEAVLINHYPFEGNANDRVGAYDGVVVGPLLTVDRFGMADSAYAFDGIDDRINIGNPNLVNFTEDFSFTMWVNPSNAGNQNNSFPTFISKYSGVGFRETFFIRLQ